MEQPDPSSLATLLVERHGKDAYARAISSLVSRQQAGDQAGERMCLKVIVAVHHLLQVSEPAYRDPPLLPTDPDLQMASGEPSIDATPATGDESRTLH